MYLNSGQFEVRRWDVRPPSDIDFKLNKQRKKIVMKQIEMGYIRNI